MKFMGICELGNHMQSFLAFLHFFFFLEERSLDFQRGLGQNRLRISALKVGKA